MYHCCRTEATYLQKVCIQQGRKKCFSFKFHQLRGHKNRSAHNWLCKTSAQVQKKTNSEAAVVMRVFPSTAAAEFSFQLRTCCSGAEREWTHTHTEQRSPSYTQKLFHLLQCGFSIGGCLCVYVSKTKLSFDLQYLKDNLAATINTVVHLVYKYTVGNEEERSLYALALPMPVWVWA